MVDGSLAVGYLARWAVQGGGRSQRNRFDAAVVPFTDLIKSRLGRHALEPLLQRPHDLATQADLARAIEQLARHDRSFDRQAGDLLARLSRAAGDGAVAGRPAAHSGTAHRAGRARRRPVTRALPILVALAAIVAVVLWWGNRESDRRESTPGAIATPSSTQDSAADPISLRSATPTATLAKTGDPKPSRLAAEPTEPLVEMPAFEQGVTDAGTFSRRVSGRGFTRVETVDRPGPTSMVGKVLKSDPTPGARVKRGTKVVLTVGSEARPEPPVKPSPANTRATSAATPTAAPSAQPSIDPGG